MKLTNIFLQKHKHHAGKISFIIATVALLQFFMASSSIASTVRLSLVEAINIALENNEDIAESFQRIDAAKADVMSAEGGYDLNTFAETSYSSMPTLSGNQYSNRASVPNATVNYQKTEVGLNQRIPTGATLRTYYTYSQEDRLGTAGQGNYFIKNYLTVELTQSLLKGIGDKEIQARIKTAMLAVEDSVEARSLSVSQITLAVIRAYWGLAVAQHNLQVAHEILDMAKEVLRREIVRNNEGISQGVDVERANLAVKQRQYTIVQYERDVKTAQDYLLLLINSPTISSHNKIIPITPLVKLEEVGLPSEKYSMDLALSERYELKQAAIVLKQLDIEYDANTNSLLPKLDVFVGGTTSQGNDYIRGAEGFSDNENSGSIFMGLSFSYPLQNREARGAVNKTRSLMRIAKDRLTKTRRTIMTEVKGSLHNFTMAKDGIPVAQKAYQLAQNVVLGEQTRFEMGGINNRDLLASHDAMGREKINYFVANVNFNVALAEYRFTCATMLEKYHITLTDSGARIQ